MMSLRIVNALSSNLAAKSSSPMTYKDRDVAQKQAEHSSVEGSCAVMLCVIASSHASCCGQAHSMASAAQWHVPQQQAVAEKAKAIPRQQSAAAHLEWASAATLAAKCRFFISSSSLRISRTTQPSNLSVIPHISPNEAPCTAASSLLSNLAFVKQACLLGKIHNLLVCNV